MKKLEIEKIKPTFNISTFKTDIILKVGLIFSISSFYINEMSLADICMSFSCSNSALCRKEKKNSGNLHEEHLGCTWSKMTPLEHTHLVNFKS